MKLKIKLFTKKKQVIQKSHIQLLRKIAPNDPDEDSKKQVEGEIITNPITLALDRLFLMTHVVP